MPYVTSFERLAREEGEHAGRHSGRVEGRVEAAREAIEEALRVRFGAVPDRVAEEIAKEADPDLLRHWLRLAIKLPSLKDFIDATGQPFADSE